MIKEIKNDQKSCNFGNKWEQNSSATLMIDGKIVQQLVRRCSRKRMMKAIKKCNWFYFEI